MHPQEHQSVVNYFTKQTGKKRMPKNNNRTGRMEAFGSPQVLMEAQWKIILNCFLCKKLPARTSQKRKDVMNIQAKVG